MSSILSLDKLSKSYGALRAVNAISFSVEKGSIHGILGPNGSGKSTTLGMLLGIVNPTGGDFSWFGKGSTDSNRKGVGALLEKPNFYPYLSGYDNLLISAKIKGISRREIDEVLEKVGLLRRKTSSFKTYSTGMKQRLAIASAMLGDPEVLIFDEPTNGLDPQGIADIRNLIAQLGREGKTILLASHILVEVEKVCSHVTILKKGNVKASGSVEEVLGKEDFTEFYLMDDDMPALERLIKAHPQFVQMKQDGAYFVVRFNGAIKAKEINSYCFEKGVVLDHLQLKQKTLEESFLEITKN